MIQDARVLQDDHLPREIVHRHEEMAQLATALEPVVEGDRPQHAVLTGPSGAGKTCIARATLDRLQEQVLDVHTAHVDCWLHHSDFRILYKLLETLGTTYDIHRSTPHDELLDRLADLEKPFLIVLDEADQIDDPDLLRRLYSVPRITMILVTNHQRDLFSPLDERLQSRLRSSDTIEFDSYTHDELVAILSDRADWGLTDGSITDDQLARLATAARGNARDAISMLRSAARNAEQAGRERIDELDIDEAIPAARAELRQKSLDRLTADQLAVYDVLREGGELMPKEITAAYQQRVDDPKSKRTVRKYLRKLEQYNLIEGSGNGPSKVYTTTSS
ncbi:AAA family ATPase [Halovenus sp. WSH3]|uniref:AAA family ATPase n=1 Tax=Halovenus carboxidivorans TaxID=2692199 RepID=A0A6B0T3P1_9EURY|nr:Cdc6/Cdc18 family protein [Halovenus carboxidivorans]MXR50806.1 AAA family ATPase [Halovenus carboxidivorans]